MNIESQGSKKILPKSLYAEVLIFRPSGKYEKIPFIKAWVFKFPEGTFIFKPWNSGWNKFNGNNWEGISKSEVPKHIQLEALLLI